MHPPLTHIHPYETRMAMFFPAKRLSTENGSCSCNSSWLTNTSKYSYLVLVRRNDATREWSKLYNLVPAVQHRQVWPTLKQECAVGKTAAFRHRLVRLVISRRIQNLYGKTEVRCFLRIKINSEAKIIGTINGPAVENIFYPMDRALITCGRRGACSHQCCL